MSRSGRKLKRGDIVSSRNTGRVVGAIAYIAKYPRKGVHVFIDTRREHPGKPGTLSIRCHLSQIELASVLDQIAWNA